MKASVFARPVPQSRASAYRIAIHTRNHCNLTVKGFYMKLTLMRYNVPERITLRPVYVFSALGALLAALAFPLLAADPPRCKLVKIVEWPVKLMRGLPVIEG